MTRKHTHQYKRTNLSKTKGKEYLVYKCAKAGCLHYLTPELVVGQLSECPRCSAEFEILPEHLKLAFPYCLACRRTKDENLYSDSL